MTRLLAAMLSLCAAAPAICATPEQDVDAYLSLFKGDPRTHNVAVQDLGWKGISDTRLYDFLERRVLDEHQAARAVRADKDRIAHYIRALGFSGQNKYRQTIARFNLDQDYMRSASLALNDLGTYARWNPEISSRASFDPKMSDDANRVMNMLRSNDLLLQRIGAKRVYFGMTEEVVVATLAERLQEYHPKTWEGEEADAVAWMAKALGHADKQRYRALLQDAVNSPTRGVRNQAASALRDR